MHNPQSGDWAAIDVVELPAPLIVTAGARATVPANADRDSDPVSDALSCSTPQQ